MYTPSYTSSPTSSGPQLSESAERFLQDIADRIGWARVTEVHLFPAVRQGGVESGLAVVAADPENPDRTTPDGLERHVVYTARYRGVVKGADRGKWEVDVKAEADAPLITVDEVVRGVVRRAGDEVHPERITGEQFRAIVPPPPQPEPAPEAPTPEPASPEPSDTPPPDSEPA